MSNKLFVGNLSFQTSGEDLEQLFTEAGKVESATLITDTMTGRSRGFGFVEMSTQQEAEEAIKQFHGREVNGRSLTVNIAKPRENGSKGPNRGSGRGGYRGSRY